MSLLSPPKQWKILSRHEEHPSSTNNFFIAESVVLKIYRSSLGTKISLYSCTALFPHLFKHKSLAKEWFIKPCLCYTCVNHMESNLDCRLAACVSLPIMTPNKNILHRDTFSITFLKPSKTSLMRYKATHIADSYLEKLTPTWKSKRSEVSTTYSLQYARTIPGRPSRDILHLSPYSLTAF